MKISQIFNLQKSQSELDFVDIDTDLDTPLFLDPYLLSKRTDPWSMEAIKTLRSFFNELITHIRAGNDTQGKGMFKHLGEPNSTCLGLSKKKPQGKGVGDLDTIKIYESIKSSKAIESGLIQDIEDNVLFVDNFGKDKLSDMTTNIITKSLMEYTINQCVLHGITLTDGIESDYYWNRSSKKWETSCGKMLIIDGRKIMLVPKGIVSFSKVYTTEKYYNHFILNFLQNEELSMASALVEHRVSGESFVTKKRLKIKYPCSKELLRSKTQEHPEILAEFKRSLQVSSLDNVEIDEGIDMDSVVNGLINLLEQIPLGVDNQKRYLSIISGILEVLFYPYLINPSIVKTNVDSFDCIKFEYNSGEDEPLFNFRCSYVHFYIMNGIGDENNLREVAEIPEDDSWVCFTLFRRIESITSIMEKVKEEYRSKGCLFLPLADKEVVELLRKHDDSDKSEFRIFINKQINKVIY